MLFFIRCFSARTNGFALKPHNYHKKSISALKTQQNEGKQYMSSQVILDYCEKCKNDSLIFFFLSQLTKILYEYYQLLIKLTFQ